MSLRVHISKRGFRIEQKINGLWHPLPEVTSERYNDREDVYKEPDGPYVPREADRVGPI